MPQEVILYGRVSKTLLYERLLNLERAFGEELVCESDPDNRYAVAVKKEYNIILQLSGKISMSALFS